MVEIGAPDEGLNLGIVVFGDEAVDGRSRQRVPGSPAAALKLWLERPAGILSLIGTACLNGLDPERYLRDVLTRIADLFPWNIRKTASPDAYLVVRSQQIEPLASFGDGSTYPNI